MEVQHLIDHVHLLVEAEGLDQLVQLGLRCCVADVPSSWLRVDRGEHSNDVLQVVGELGVGDDGPALLLDLLVFEVGIDDRLHVLVAAVAEQAITEGVALVARLLGVGVERVAQMLTELVEVERLALCPIGEHG